MKKLPRLPGLFGLVALTALGRGSDPVLAETAKAPVNHAVPANNDFAFDLYGQLSGENKGRNLFFSPYSISNVLVILAEGARNETAGELGQVLRFPQATRRTGDDARSQPWNLEPIHSSMAGLNKRFKEANRPAPKSLLDKLASSRKEYEASLRTAKTKPFKERKKVLEGLVKMAMEIRKLEEQIDRYELLVATGLWSEKTFPVKQSWIETINKHHHVSSIPVDFRKDPDAARKRINAWGEKHTRSRIKDLVGPKAIDELTRLVVANAIYFKGQWREPFVPGQTRDLPFTLADGKKVETAMMHGFKRGTRFRFMDAVRAGDKGGARYGAFEKDGAFFDTPADLEDEPKAKKGLYPGDGGFEVLELPYKGGELAMVVLLPRSAAGLPALEKKLSAAKLRTWLEKLRQRPVEVFLPKFKMEMPIDLKKSLQALGMKRGFADPRLKDGAQFDGMSEGRAATEKLYLGAVFHHAFVEVNEKGTEATALSSGKGKAKGYQPFEPTFKADRPFVFLIRDQESGAILFLGRFLNPRPGG